MVTHHQMSPTIERPMKAMPVIALSAIGSAILPKLVTRLRVRAMSPSILSVIIAATNSANATQRHGDRVAAVVQQRPAEERHHHDPQRGQRVGQVPVAGLAARRPRVITARRREQVDTFGVDDDRAHEVADPRAGRHAGSVVPSTSGPWWAARPSASSVLERSRRAPRRSSPIRSSARWAVELLDQARSRARRGRGPRPRRACRRTSRPRCRPRRSSRTRR